MDTRRLTFKAAIALAAMVTTAGCQDQLNSLASSYPVLAPYVGGRAAPTPFVLNTGSIKGFVYGAAGKSQPIPLAFVTTGSVSSFAGNPDTTNAVAETDEFTNDADGTKPHFDVLHDFNDGAGAVATDRIIRVHVPAADPAADDATNSRRQYVYLRAGEFFLEDVPEGISKLTSSFGNVSSAPNPVTVYANQLVDGVTLNLFIPEPVVTDDGKAAKVVQWTDLSPSTGISVQVDDKTTEQTSGPPIHDVTITYKPDPPDVNVTLKAPPGSAGAVINAIDIVYVFNTSNRQTAGKPSEEIGPIRLPVPPIIIAPAQEIAFGPPSIITVPIGSASLRQVFLPSDPADQPGLIICNMEFIDDQGFAIQDKSFQNLQVSAVLRSL